MASAAELAQRRADLLAIEDDTMTVDGTDYSGVFTQIDVADTPQVGGFVRDYSASFHVRAALFTGTIPGADTAVTVNGYALKVIQVIKDPDGVALEFRLAAPDGG